MMRMTVGGFAMPRRRWGPVPVGPESNKETVGAVLRRERLARGWSHKDVEAKIEASTTRISAWENDRGLPSLANMRALERLFGLPRNYLSDLIDDGEREFGLADELPETYVAIPDDEPLVGAVKRLYVLEDDELRTLADLSDEEWQAFVRGMRGLGDPSGEVETLDDMDEPDEGEAPAPKRRRTAG